jgi:cyclophilin family peptidyl-prolyl cis-trans isomerase
MRTVQRALTLSVALLICAMIAGVSGGAQTKGKSTQGKGKATVYLKETAVLVTSMGNVECELYRSDAPKTVENFVKLAGERFFDGMRFHRVVPGFVVQTGDDKSKDPKKTTEWGTGGKSIYGNEFADELNAETQSYKDGYKKGVLAMANHGRNTNSSQFFIMLADNTTLPKNYTIFGKVVNGMDVVEKIGRVELVPPGARDGRPKEDVLLKKVTIRNETGGK